MHPPAMVLPQAAGANPTEGEGGAGELDQRVVEADPAGGDLLHHKVARGAEGRREGGREGGASPHVGMGVVESEGSDFSVSPSSLSDTSLPPSLPPSFPPSFLPSLLSHLSLAKI